MARHPAQARRALFGADAEPEGLRGARCARRRRRDRRCSARATEAFSKRNINCSIAESIERFAPVVAAAQRRRHQGARLRSPSRSAARTRARSRPSEVERVARADEEIGVRDCGSADTIGVGTPRQGAGARCEARAEALSRSTRSPAISTTPTARRWPTSTPASSSASRTFDASRRRPRRLPVRQGRDRQRRHRGRACTCCTASASRPASTSTGWSTPATFISRRARPQAGLALGECAARQARAAASAAAEAVLAATL